MDEDEDGLSSQRNRRTAPRATTAELPQGTPALAAQHPPTAAAPTAATTTTQPRERSAADSDEELDYEDALPAVSLGEKIPLTPIPPSGAFDKPHLAEVDSLHYRQLPAQLVDWATAPGSKVFVTRYGATVWSEKGSTQALLEEVLKALGFPDALVAPPVAEGRREHDGPVVFLVYGLTEGEQRTLLKRFCWSTPLCTFFCYPPCVQPIPTHIGQFSGFVRPDEAGIRAAFLHHLSQGQLAQLIGHLAAEHPDYAGLPEETAVARVLSTVRVTVLTMKEPGGFLRKHVANLYINSPTMYVDKWKIFRATLRRYVYTSGLLGAGRFRPRSAAPPCSGCLGADHPRGLCPFPHLPHWHGPPPTTLNEDQDIPAHLTHAGFAQGQARGRGNGRGRGRGRGRGGH